VESWVTPPRPSMSWPARMMVIPTVVLQILR
jgi:hypothetical protein